MNGVYSALISGFEEMKKQFVNRIVLELCEFDTTRLQNITLSSLLYYPFDLFTNDEKRLVAECKSYSIVALVQENADGIISYKNDSIEKYGGSS
ncbi:MAG: hypothetical protein AB1571_03095 [Nanoarchaeota archaeon]